MKSRIFFFALIGVALTMTPSLALAGSCDSTHAGPMKKKFAELNLTTDQKDKLKALHKEGMETAKPLFDQMKAIREKVKAELLKSEPSKPVLDQYAAQLGDLNRQLIQNMHTQALKAKTILTPEQFSKMVNFEWVGPGPGMPGMHKGKDDHERDRDKE
jgi:Spy/CpxP family protein refolding chaperone